jgi:hypothetical protein
MPKPQTWSHSMNIQPMQPNPFNRRPPKWSLLIIAFYFLPGASWAVKHCSKTAVYALSACKHEVKDDFWTSLGNCQNIADSIQRGECKQEAKSARTEGREECKEQYDARRDLCEALGEAPYAPEFEPANFVDPLQIGAAVTPNPYFPLEQGRSWTYAGGDEVITVTVTDKTKLIGGVTCLVVNDRVEEDGDVIEDTDDWYAQDIDGNVWYCGEIARDFETTDGDDDPELVSIDGSWKAFRNSAKPGILMKAAPQVGEVYRQEFALGDAEDAAEVLSTTSSDTVPAAACANNCVVTKDFTPIEPDAFEHKYYAPGVGLILEVNPETGERVELTTVTSP